MIFQEYGQNTNLEDIIRIRTQDALTVNQMQKNKRNGRDRNGVRAVPTGHADVISGDTLGDYLTDGTFYYELISMNGVTLWGKYSPDITW